MDDGLVVAVCPPAAARLVTNDDLDLDDLGVPYVATFMADDEGAWKLVEFAGMDVTPVF